MKTLFGVTVAMVTPFKKNGEVDYEAIRQLTNYLIKKGVNCLYPCGTTGEMLRLSLSERKKIAETVVKTAAGKVTVFVHTGAATEEDTIELTQHAQKIGADGVGVVTPQFFSVNDEEMEEYYVSIGKSVKNTFPIYLYNIPQCAGNDLKTETILKITRRCENVIGVKYSYADMSRTLEYIHINNGNFSVLHGCDKLFLSLLLMGCDGTVSGCANVFPEPFVNTYKAYMNMDIAGARKWQEICVKCVDKLYAGVNMSYFKEGLKIRGLNGGFMRKPQLDIESKKLETLKKDIICICKEAKLPLKLVKQYKPPSGAWET